MYSFIKSSDEILIATKHGRLLLDKIYLLFIIALKTSTKYGSFITVNKINQWNVNWVVRATIVQYIFC